MLDCGLVVDYLPFMIEAAWVTLKISILSTAFGLVLGLVVALLKISTIKVLVHFANLYLWIIRGTPILVQLFLIYYGLPQVGIELTPMTAAVVALGINAAAYIAEIYRGGIMSISQGQMEAAESLGMGYFLRMRKIVLPQALRVSLPSLGNQAIMMLKDSSLASLVTVSELLMVSQRYAASNYAFIEFYIVAAAFYLFMTTIFTFILTRVEKRISIGEV
mgnify:FL=1